MRGRTRDFGPVDIKRRVASSSYTTRQGIVLFRNFWAAGNQGDHIDVWDGTAMAHGDASYFSASQEVWFWDLA